MRRRALSMVLAAGLAWAVSGSRQVSGRSSAAEEDATAQQPAENGVDVTWGFKIPLRDGVALDAVVYRPGGQREPLPVILVLTPYMTDSAHELSMYLARRGYVFVDVDLRGRGDARGVFEPFANDARDGYDVVEALARQPWSNGKVAMLGGSYSGFAQWTTLKEAPPHLATIVPVASVGPGIDWPSFHNVYIAEDMQWLTLVEGVTSRFKVYADTAFWIQRDLELYRQQAPFDTLDRVVGNPSPIFQKWLQHPSLDAYWRAMLPTPAQYARMSAPILSITGHYDDDQTGALSYYRDFMRYATPAERDRHWLVIGPWDHGGTRKPRRQMGGLDLGEASLVDLDQLHKEWYDWTLKSGERPAFLKKHVAYYVLGDGANTWKYADSLDTVATGRRTFYLDSPGGQASDAFRSGALAAAPPPAQAAPDHYVYDPRDLRHGVWEEHHDPASLTDQTAALTLAGEGVIYHSEPFTEPTEISGSPKLSVWMSIDVPDTDFSVTLYEVKADGGGVLLSSDLLRALLAPEAPGAPWVAAAPGHLPHVPRGCRSSTMSPHRLRRGAWHLAPRRSQRGATDFHHGLLDQLS